MSGMKKNKAKLNGKGPWQRRNSAARRRARERAEERYWASLAGPVTIRYKKDEPNAV